MKIYEKCNKSVTEHLECNFSSMGCVNIPSCKNDIYQLRLQLGITYLR